MQESVRNDIIYILKETLEELPKLNTRRMKDLSNHTLHSSTIYNDERAITTAVSIYALAKTIEKEKIKRHHAKEWNEFIKKAKIFLKESLNAISKNNIPLFDKSMGKLVSATEALDENYGYYIEYILNKAKVNKAERLYEHGLSMGTVAELLGISKWELMQYAGFSRIHDNPDTISAKIKERIKNARGLLE